MKRFLGIVLSVILLSGCGSSNSTLDHALLLRKEILGGNGCTFQAEITADYGDEIYEFQMDCQEDGEGNLSFTVIEPETIFGISGIVSATGGKLTFDDKALLFDTLAEGQITPVSAPWLLMHTLRSGYIKGCGKSEGGIFLQIDDSYQDDAIHMDIWLDEYNFPFRAEILWQDKRIVSLEIEDFEIL